MDTKQKAKPRYINNSQVQAPAPEPCPSAKILRHGKLCELRWDELTRKEREDLEAAHRRAEYCSLFNIYEMYG